MATTDPNDSNPIATAHTTRLRATKAATGTKIIKKSESDSESEPEKTTTAAKHSTTTTTVTTTVTTTNTTLKRKIKAEPDASTKPTSAAAAAPKKRKTAAEKKAMSGPLAARLLNPRLLLGAHVSMAKGVQNAITNSQNIGGNALALFLKSQRKWVSPALAARDIAQFKENCTKHNYNPRTQILPHGSYLINLANGDREKQIQAYDCFLDDLKRCELLNIGLYNFHPGSTLGAPRDEALGRIAAALNRAHKETRFVKTVIENMVGAGNVVGSSFEDLRDIINGVEDKSRVGICLDTCHMFAAGHDIRTAASYAKVMDSFDEIVGREYLCAMHINDSKGPFQSKKDLHENIGVGYIGLEAFRVLVNDKRLEGLPMVLETPNDEDPGVWAQEIKLLESLVGMTGEEEEFISKAKELQEKGKGERERIGTMVAKSKTKKAPVKRGKKAKAESEDEDSDEGCSH